MSDPPLRLAPPLSPLARDRLLARLGAHVQRWNVQGVRPGLPRGPRDCKETMIHVVALSGGKDSTALALRLAEIEPREYERKAKA